MDREDGDDEGIVVERVDRDDAGGGGDGGEGTFRRQRDLELQIGKAVGSGRRGEIEGAVAADLRASDRDEVNAAAMMAGGVAATDGHEEVDESVDAAGAESDLKTEVEDGGHGESVENAKELCAEVEAGDGDGKRDAASVNGCLVHGDVGDADESDREVWKGEVVVPCQGVGLGLCRGQNRPCPC